MSVRKCDACVDSCSATYAHIKELHELLKPGEPLQESVRSCMDDLCELIDTVIRERTTRRGSGQR